MKTINAASLFLTLILAACATSTKTDLVQVVKKRAAYDLKCDAGSLTVTELSEGQSMANGMAATDQRSFGIDGCGQRASYYAYCTNMFGNESCEAIPTPAAGQAVQ